MNLRPSRIDELQQLVRTTPRLTPKGGGSKWRIAAPPDGAVLVDMTAIRGVSAYDPAEFTFTARAGTPLTEIEALLAERGQYLPFDPPRVAQGATLGGAIAAGWSGPSRLRYGGVRDFILGVKLIDGEGRLTGGGGRVVKNAAGFDLPKLLCGSRGRLGILVELTLKVFPRPEAFASLRLRFADVAAAAERMRALMRSPLAPHALDLVAPVEGDDYALLVRTGGPREALAGVLARLETAAGQAGERLDSEQDAALWLAQREPFGAEPTAPLVRIQLLPAQVERLDAFLQRLGAQRIFSLGGHLAWAALPQDADWRALETGLAELGAVATIARGGPPDRVVLNASASNPFARRVKAALDPFERFGPLDPAADRSPAPAKGVG
ncbi:MAG TPA: FAD-binding protein [Limnochordia bacterium]|nr:FAD-binding protein [Limnochordia bacterium]